MKLSTAWDDSFMKELGGTERRRIMKINLVEHQSKEEVLCKL